MFTVQSCLSTISILFKRFRVHVVVVDVFFFFGLGIIVESPSLERQSYKSQESERVKITFHTLQSVHALSVDTTGAITVLLVYRPKHRTDQHTENKAHKLICIKNGSNFSIADENALNVLCVNNGFN